MDETTTEADLEGVCRAFGILKPPTQVLPAIPDALVRTSEYLTHPIFHMNRAESEMMRYMRRLSDRDLALDRAMIPLGSCTMKLNASVEMMPITWPEFNAIHPFAPADQAEGYAAMIEDLAARLCEITGYDAMSMQPNSGAQGEYAGLLTIAAYHRARGDRERDICLIPVSAHGTNPASAQMAGMEVVVVAAAGNGDIDLADFTAKAEAAGDRLAAAMITYPSTHGVFEETVREVCRITHEHGGQVYLDGANLKRDGGGLAPRRPWCGCQPPEPAQDLLHSPWRGRAGHGAHRGQGASGVASSGPSRDGRTERAGFGRAVRLRLDPADLLRLYPPDGRRGPDAGDQGRDPERKTTSPRVWTGRSRCCSPDRKGAWPMSASLTRDPSRRRA